MMYVNHTSLGLETLFIFFVLHGMHYTPCCCCCQAENSLFRI